MVPKVVKLDPAKFCHHPIGDATGHLTHQPVIFAARTPATNEIIAFLDFFQEPGDFFGVVLQIAVHGDNHFSAGKIEAGFQGRSLAKIAAQPNNIHAPIVFINFG